LRSSTWIGRGFCAACGARLMDRYLQGNDLVSATVGSLNHPKGWSPNEHVGIESEIPWLVIYDDLPRMRTDADPDFLAGEDLAEDLTKTRDRIAQEELVGGVRKIAVEHQ
jgi:hypothetical protein